MLRRFGTLLRRFHRDERGVFLPLFGVMAIVLVATSGAVVDFVGVSQARNEAQIALDAATLALQPSIYTKSDAAIQSDAQAILRERMGIPTAGGVNLSGISASITDITTDDEDGMLYLKAELNIPTNFVSLVGVPEMNVAVISQATRKKLYVEVAFVLDNSGSMASSSRMSNLKSASKCAVRILYYGVDDCSTSTWGMVPAENVSAAVIPFTTFVNVGTGNASASWMDTTGISPVSWENFDDDDDDTTPYTGPMSRFDRYNDLQNVSWEGCVEARPYPYSTDDTPPDTGNPETLFVPVFAPDEPDGNWSFNNSYIDDTPDACSGTIIGTCECAFWEGRRYRSSPGNYCNFDPNGSGLPSQSGADKCTCSQTPSYWYWSEDYGNVYRYSCTNGVAGSGYTGADNGAGLSDREKQERICKYDGAWADTRSGRGPNADCVGTPILPLDGDPDNVIDRINAMSANGMTNIHQGTIWGYHSLTPSEPMTGGRGYDTAVSKVMIIMTDGENTYVGDNSMNQSDLQAYGMYWKDKNPNDRIGIDTSNQWSVPPAMNTLTEETCTNAKEDGITVYTIGLEPPNSATRNMLEACATTASHAYFPNAASELSDVFKDIAEQLAQLRLER